MESDWTTPLERIPFLYQSDLFEQGSNNQLKESFQRLKKNSKDCYHYLQLSLALLKSPLYKRESFHQKTMLLNLLIIAIIILISVWIVFSGWGGYQAMMKNYLSNPIVINGLFAGLIFIGYLALEQLFRKIWFYKGGSLGAILTFLETRKIVKESLFSRKFVIQYLINLLLARYGVDPYRKDDWNIVFSDNFQIPKNSNEYQRFLVIGKNSVEFHHVNGDPREPHSFKRYESLDLFIMEHISQRIGNNVAALHALLTEGKVTVDSIEKISKHYEESITFMKKDLQRVMRSLSYRLPRFFLRV